MYSPKSEEKWLAFWEKNQSFQKSVAQRSPQKPYIFYDGPPFATGTPHQGHILGLTIKDVFPRYFTMKGFRVERRWGWDCHGLPIENKVEQLKGIKNKKQIEEMGVKAFNDACAAQVLTYAHEWGKTVRRMGKWIEFENAYKTMDQPYMETVWWAFKQLYEKGHVYEGKKILMYCPRCQTPLAKAEIAMDNSYKNVTEPTVFVKFKVKGEENTFILAWTTTPWTLIGNAALAVNGKLKYVKVQQGNEFFILGKDLVKVLQGEYKIVEEFDGKKLCGKEYEALYHLDTDKKGHYVVDGGEGVTAEEGTGIVHIAAYGEFDYELIKKYDLPLFTHVGEDGMLHGGHEDWKGLWFKKVDPKIITDLDERKLVYKQEKHTHSYPFCYRCETPLFYKPMDSWFVRIQNVKEKILKQAEKIKWHPENVAKKRYEYIVETMPDWNISRNRYWATAIPVWKCKACGEMKVVGSVKELQEHAIEPVPNGVDLHKHTVDEIHLKCKCGKPMSRIPEVIDCWFESGAMPYASRHYPFEHKNKLKTFFPADFISEYVGQIRAWFNYMHVLGTLLFDEAPFQHAVVSGNILASDGNKMSKSKNNFTDPFVLFEKFGADALRFHLMQSPVTQAQDVNFKDDGVQEAYRKVVLLAANTLSFYQMYGQGNNQLGNPHSEHVLDQWAVARTHQTLGEVTKAMDAYDTIAACNSITGLVNDVSTWYLRRSRERFKGEDVQDKTNAVRTLGYTLHLLSKMMAPITPFIAEEIHQALRVDNAQLKESVHLEDWPAVSDKVDAQIYNQMMALREAVRKGLEQRDKAKLPVRQPLAAAKIQTFIELTPAHVDIFKDEMNVKNVELELVKESKEVETTVELDTNLTPELVAEGAARELVRMIQDLRKQAKCNPTDGVKVFVSASSEFQEMLASHVEDVKSKVRATQLTFEKASDPLVSGESTIKNEPIKVELENE